MRSLMAEIEGLSPYSQSRYHDEPRESDEGPGEYDQRTWRSKCTVDKEGIVCIPGMAIKMAMDSAARKLQEKNPSKRGAKSFIDYIVGGVFPSEDRFPIGVKVDDIEPIDLWVNADGKRGSGKRVMRRFPIVPKRWKALIFLDITDDTLPTEVVERHLIEAGATVGIGRFRPEKGGMNGRFAVKSFTWKEDALAA